MTAKKKYSAPALDKGLDILELLSQHADGLTQGAIAKSLGRSQSEIYRMLSTLVDREYVIRSEMDDRYSLSLKMFAISQRHPPVSRALEAALPKMRAVTQKMQQSCHIGLESNGEIVVVASVPSQNQWGVTIKAGSVVGLWNTGTGRVLAAFSSPEDLDTMIAHHRLAPGEPELDRQQFEENLERIRQRGYEMMPSETAVGVTNISFPIFGASHEIVAALSCPYLERRDACPAPSVKDVTNLMENLANELTESFGGTMPEFRQLHAAQ